jgi:O-antigen/teichoic acid export membrane protein
MQLRSFARNTFFLVASQAFGAVMTLAFVPLLARYLGLENYGRYSYVYAFVGLFEVLSVFGLHQIFVREVARDRHKASGYLGNVLRLKVLLSLGVFALIYLASRILVEPGLQLFVLIVATEVLLRKFFLINLALARAFERMEYELVVTIFERTTALVGVLAAIRFDWGLGGIFLAFLSAAVVHAFLATVLVWKRLVRPNFTSIQGFGRAFFSNSWPLGVSHQASVAYGRIGPVFLDHWHGAAIVGVYSGGYRIYQILQIVVAEAISRAALPTFSRLSLEPQRLTRFMLRVVLLDALTGACLGAFLWMLAPIAIGILLGPEFEASVSILRWMAVAIPFAYLSSLLSAALQSLDLQFVDGFLTIGTLLVSLIVSVILIPALGAVGSAWALIAAEIFGFSTKSLALVFRGFPAVKSKRSVLKQL